MKSIIEQQKGEELLQTLVTKAWESVSFKEQLINNPQAAIESVTCKKINLVEGTKLIVEDQTDLNIVYLNIPQKPDFENIELSDEELEQVSGGVTPWILFVGAMALGKAMQD